MDSRLPKDITFEILSRTTLPSFNAMRCTNKEINNLTYDSDLVDLHKQRNDGIVSGLITQTNPHGYSKNHIIDFAPSRGSKSLDLSFLPDLAQIRASSDHGIIVLEKNPLLFYVCKPATKQLIQLPSPTKTENITDYVVIVVMDSEPLRYKIFRFSRYTWLRLDKPTNDILWRNRLTYSCEIFDSSACELEWRVSNPLEVVYRGFIHSQPITVRGSIYILLANFNVIKYDPYLEKRTSTTFLVPEETHDIFQNSSRRLVNYEGNLGYAYRKLGCFWKIWVRNSIDESWAKPFVLNKRESIIKQTWSFTGFCDSDTAIMMKNCNVLFYRFKRDDDNIGPDEAFVKLRNNFPDETFVLRSDFDQVDLVPCTAKNVVTTR